MPWSASARGRNGRSADRCRRRRRGARAGGRRRVRARRHDDHGRRGHDVRELEPVLADHGQECAARPARSAPRRSAACSRAACRASGGCATGRSAITCSRCAFVTADGRLVKGGGPTVKNVTGYDLPRLFVGSLGTLGVLVQATLRCRPRRPRRALVRRRPTRPTRCDGACRAAVLCGTATTTHVLLEGDSRPTSKRSRRGRGTPVERPPTLPDGPHRGRISVRPACRRRRPRARRDRGCRWCAEVGVGTVHVAADDRRRARRARAPSRTRHGGWLLREAGGGADVDGFGRDAPQRRARCAASRTRSTPRASSRPGGCRCDRRPGRCDLDEDELVACVVVRALPPALPDLPRDGARDRVAARPHRGDARSSSWTARRSTTRSARAMDECVQCRGCEAACPSSVQFGHLMEDTRAALHRLDAPRPGRRRRTGRRARVSEWVAYRVVLPRARAAARAHVGRAGSRSGCASSRGDSACRRSRRARCATPLDVPVGGRPDAWCFTGLRDGRVAARHATASTARVHARGGRSCRAAGARRRLLRRAARARGAGDEARAPRPARDRVDARRRAGRRRQRGLRRGDEGLRATARHTRGRGVQRAGPRLLGVGRRAARRRRSADREHGRRAGSVPPAPRAARAPARAHRPRATRTTLVETDDDGLCCGAGGAYAVLQPDLAVAIRDRKVAALRTRGSRATRHRRVLGEPRLHHAPACRGRRRRASRGAPRPRARRE